MLLNYLEKLAKLIKFACGGYMVYVGSQIQNSYPDVTVQIPAGFGFIMIGIFMINMRIS